jgi:hypothetical protein
MAVCGLERAVGLADTVKPEPEQVRGCPRAEVQQASENGKTFARQPTAWSYSGFQVD